MQITTVILILLQLQPLHLACIQHIFQSICHAVTVYSLPRAVFCLLYYAVSSQHPAELTTATALPLQGHRLLLTKQLPQHLHQVPLVADSNKPHSLNNALTEHPDRGPSTADVIHKHQHLLTGHQDRGNSTSDINHSHQHLSTVHPHRSPSTSDSSHSNLHLPTQHPYRGNSTSDINPGNLHLSTGHSYRANSTSDVSPSLQHLPTVQATRHSATANSSHGRGRFMLDATARVRSGSPELSSASRAIRIAFYLWLTLVNLLATSTLWARAADAFDSNAAVRLFGFLGAGATLGRFYSDDADSLAATGLTYQ